MADDGDDAGHQGNAHDVVAHLLHQGIDDLVEHAGIGHDTEEQHREDEQDGRAVDTGDTGLDEAGHVIQREGTGDHQNGGRDGGYADEGQRRDCDVAQQQHDDRDHRSKAEQREDSFAHDSTSFPFSAGFAGGTIPDGFGVPFPLSMAPV